MKKCLDAEPCSIRKPLLNKGVHVVGARCTMPLPPPCVVPSRCIMPLQIFMFLLLGLWISGGNLKAQSQIFQQPLSQRIANYQIKVRLIPEQKALQGEEILTWHNTSPDSIHELYFHLYMNAFRNLKSTFMKESGGRLRHSRFEHGKWGYIEIKNLQLIDGTDLTSAIQYVSPDDNNSDDMTVMKVPLSIPLPPGGKVRLRIEFHVQLPRVFVRAGYGGDFFMVGQWFPKIGVYQNGRWNCHQYHATSEFFADFGVYDVTIEVPKSFVVAASGVLVAVDSTDTTRILHYRSEDVHDFAWAADPLFKIAKEFYKNIEINLYFRPWRKKLVSRYLSAVKNALNYFENWIGPYPYPTLTLVDPPLAASGAGGMEYPTLITVGSPWWMPKGFRLPEMVAIHEFGHQYWYGMVASNEFEEAWLDEGINTYSEIRILGTFYGTRTSVLDLWGIQIGDDELQWTSYMFMPQFDPILRPTWEYLNHRSYGVNAYHKPAMMLLTLENYLGTEAMDQIMRTYFQHWKFKHPTSKDFIQVVNEVSGQKMDWFFEQFFYETGYLDYAVHSISSKRQRTIAKVATSQDSLQAPIKDSTKAVYHSEVILKRNGEFILPVTFEVHFTNGNVIVESWSGRERWVKFEYDEPAKIDYVTIDPQKKLWLDIDFVNNTLIAKKSIKGVNFISLKWLFWIQNLLQFFAFFS
ncbi:M1 family peptidase [candidate division KSB1 bacterium]|nr:MAG: M1 family peptidase [candidate division KSB1 bacterium]